MKVESLIPYVNEIKEDWEVIFDSSLPKDTTATEDQLIKIREFFAKFKK